MQCSWGSFRDPGEWALQPWGWAKYVASSNSVPNRNLIHRMNRGQKILAWEIDRLTDAEEAVLPIHQILTPEHTVSPSFMKILLLSILKQSLIEFQVSCFFSVYSAGTCFALWNFCFLRNGPLFVYLVLCGLSTFRGLLMITYYQTMCHLSLGFVSN